MTTVKVGVVDLWWHWKLCIATMRYSPMVVRPSLQREGANSHSNLRVALYCDLGPAWDSRENEWFIEGDGRRRKRVKFTGQSPIQNLETFVAYACEQCRGCEYIGKGENDKRISNMASAMPHNQRLA
jgi:hypothetical protein